MLERYTHSSLTCSPDTRLWGERALVVVQVDLLLSFTEFRCYTQNRHQATPQASQRH